MTGIRARQKLATQERVLMAARTLFLARPYEEVGVRDIAAEAGVATGTVIGAYGSKADLLNMIVIDDYLAQFELMKQSVLGKDKILDRVLAMAMACARYHQSQLPLLRASLAHSWIRTQNAESQVRDAIRPIFSFIRDELATAQILGDIAGDAELWTITELLHDVLVSAYRKLAYDDMSLAEIELTLTARFKVILNGIAPAAAQQPGASSTGAAVNAA